MAVPGFCRGARQGEWEGVEWGMVTDTHAPWAEPAPVTAELLLHFPKDEWRYELVAGRLVRMTPTGFDHGRISLRLGSILLSFVDEHGLGVVCGAETGFVLSAAGEPDTVLAPDVAFITADRAPKDVSGFARLAPDLVCEVASPGQTNQQLAVKARIYLTAGVRQVWILWPHERSVHVWLADRSSALQLGQDDTLSGGSLLSGFTLLVRDLFG